jgi:hypothetical protein
MDPQLAKQLTAISTEIARKKQQIAQLEQQRNVLIQEALVASWSHAQIAATTGLTRGRIGQIATDN